MKDEHLINMLTFYGLKPYPKMMEGIKKAILQDDREDHAYCKAHIKDKLSKKGKMPEGSAFNN